MTFDNSYVAPPPIIMSIVEHSTLMLCHPLDFKVSFKLQIATESSGVPSQILIKIILVMTYPHLDQSF